MKRFRNTIRHPDKKSSKAKTASLLYYDHCVDLHGLTSDQAIVRLRSFMQSHRSSTILVNHGKGSGILRAQVRSFLRESIGSSKIRFGESIPLPEGDGVTLIEV